MASLDEKVGQVLQMLTLQGQHVAAQMAEQQRIQQQQVEALREIVDGKNKKNALVDSTKLGKPEFLKGPGKDAIRKNWLDRCLFFKIWLCTREEHGEAMLQWAQDQQEKQIDADSMKEVVANHHPA